MIEHGFDGAQVFRLVVAVSVLGVVITSLEDASMVSTFADDGLLSWEVAKTRSRRYVRGRLSTLFDSVFRYDTFRYVIYVRLLAALLTGVVVSLSGNHYLLPPLLALLLVTTIAISVRSTSGLDGSHQLNILVFASLLLYSVSPAGSLARDVCLWFIGIQTIWAYFSAGVHKAIASEWRNGIALRKIMSTSSYGNDRLYYLFRNHPRVGRFCSIGIIAFECAFFLVLVVDVNVALVFLGAGAVFHGMNAVFMGLNSFFFSFVATYPAVLYLSLTISSALA